MIKITDGIHTFSVTRGAYEGLYRHQGYHPYGQADAAKVEDSWSVPETTAGAPVSEAGMDAPVQSPAEAPAEAAAPETAAPAEPEKTADELFCEEVEEKPIAQWNKDEIKKYAELRKIDITGTKNPNEARERIKAFLNV